VALAFDHRLNGRRHRRVHHAANRQNNRICVPELTDVKNPEARA
jgi:hypothetical protein